MTASRIRVVASRRPRQRRSNARRPEIHPEPSKFSLRGTRIDIDKRIKAAAFLAILGSIPSAASANHIDFFDGGNFSVNGGNTGRSTTVSGIPTASTLGGRRVVIAFSSPGTATASLNAVNPGTDDDALIFSSGQATGTTLTIDYGLGGELNADFLDIPGMDAQWDRFRLNFGAGSFPGSFVLITLISIENGGRASVG